MDLNCIKHGLKVGLIYWLFLPMIALIMKRIIISLKAIFKARLSLAAVVICAYYKYVIFVRYGTLFGHDNHIVQSSSALASYPYKCIGVFSIKSLIVNSKYLIIISEH